MRLAKLISKLDLVIENEMKQDGLEAQSIEAARERVKVLMFTIRISIQFIINSDRILGFCSITAHLYIFLCCSLSSTHLS